MKNKRAGGGAVIPCNWLLHVAKGGESFKKVTKITNAIRSIGFSIDDFKGMEIRVHINFTLIHVAVVRHNKTWLKI